MAPPSECSLSHISPSLLWGFLVFSARAMLALQALYLATAIPSVRLSVRPSVRPSVCLSVTRRYCVKTTARSTVQFARWIAKCVWFCRNQKIFSRVNPFPLKFWLQVTYSLLKAASFDAFCPSESYGEESYWRMTFPVFTARRNARIASAVVAYGNSVCLFVCPSVCLSHAGIVSKRRHVARCSLHCQIAKCV